MSDSRNRRPHSCSGRVLVNSITKLQLDENIAAYIEKRLLVRDKHIAVCYKDNYIESIVTNYVIAKQILRNLIWQEKLLYKHVCKTWHSAVNSLRREQLSPVDFSLKHDQVIQSSIFTNEPLAVFTFINVALPDAPNIKKCKNVLPRCCDPPCENSHFAVDVIHKLTTAPKECMMAVKALYVTYMPLPHSKTNENTIGSTQVSPFIGGIFIPVIPNVKFHILNLKDTEQVLQEFCTAIDAIVKDQVIKGLLVFVSSKFLLNSIEKIVFLDYVKEVQPNIPYAMGGCVCEDTIIGSNDINYFINNTSRDATTDNLLSIGIFTIPKNVENGSNFDMFSYVMQSSEWDSDKIHACISQFSQSVPRYEHSVCLKVACIGRDRMHKFEQDTFRSFFPDTPVVGCCGNGEVGINHPGPSSSEPPKKAPKKFRLGARKGIPGPHFGLVYAYATVFVYMGWGKITVPAKSST